MNENGEPATLVYILDKIIEKEKELSDYHTENILQLARSKEFLRVKGNLFGDKSQAASKDLSNLEQEILDNGALVTLNSYLFHLQYLLQNHQQTSHSDVYHITKSNIILNNNNYSWLKFLIRVNLMSQ